MRRLKWSFRVAGVTCVLLENGFIAFLDARSGRGA